MFERVDFLPCRINFREGDFRFTQAFFFAVAFRDDFSPRVDYARMTITFRACFFIYATLVRRNNIRQVFYRARLQQRQPMRFSRLLGEISRNKDHVSILSDKALYNSGNLKS